MTDATPRRTDSSRLRGTISALLEHADAIEYAMGLFYRKGDQRELARAAENYDAMLAEVDRLGDMIKPVRPRLPTASLRPSAKSRKSSRRNELRRYPQNRIGL